MSEFSQLKGKKMFPSLGLIFAALSLARCAPLQQASSRSKLLLVSFDGFRWNYDQDVDTPNLDTMAAEGVKAQYMTPAFITITSPCHFTLLTGESPLTTLQAKGAEEAGCRMPGGEQI
uniref:Uncharacterized protein n=1 Tax=Apteryx owenii TaxID=8824 RepID=A0A8B9NZ09_APTOW